MRSVVIILCLTPIVACVAQAGLSIDTTPVLPTGEVHPSLYFQSEDLPLLNERVETIPYAGWWAEVVSKSNSYLGRDLTSPDLSEEERSKGAKACAFAYVVTADHAYANKAKEALSAMWASPGSDDRRMLEAAYHLQNYCEAYDWIQVTLSSSNDSIVRTKLALEAERFYNDPVMWSPFGYVNNWGVKAAAALGTVALTISDCSSAAHTPSQWLGRALDRINVLLAVLTTDDGLWLEGSHYLIYTSGNLVPFLWHYKNVSDVNLFDDLHPLFDFVITVRCPDGRLPNLEDAYSNVFPHSMVAPAYREVDAPVHMWAYEEGPGFDEVWWTQDVKEVDLIIVHDASIPSSPPSHGPTVFLPHCRVAVLRSSWENDGIYLYLNGAPDYYNLLAGGVHTHADPLEVILFAHKAVLANDAGYGPAGFNDDNRFWYTSPEAHNIVLVNGTAPQNAPITVRQWLASEDVAFAKMAATYGGATISRSAVLVGNEFAVVSDHVTADGEKRFDFVLHGRGEMTHSGRQVRWSVMNEDSVDVDLLTYLFPSTHIIDSRSGLSSFAYGQEEHGQYITSHVEGTETHHVSLLFPKHASAPPPVVDELAGAGCTGARINDDLIFVQGDTLVLSLEDLESDAGLTYVRGTHHFPVTWLIDDGTTFRWETMLLMGSTARISLAAGPLTESRFPLMVSPNVRRCNLYLALPESLWATAVALDEEDIPFYRKADGVSVELDGGGRLVVELAPALKGDVIPDRAFTVLDLLRTVNLMLGRGSEPTRHELWAADTNYDGTIDLVDLFDIVFIILSNR